MDEDEAARWEAEMLEEYQAFIRSRGDDYINELLNGADDEDF